MIGISQTDVQNGGNQEHNNINQGVDNAETLSTSLYQIFNSLGPLIFVLGVGAMIGFSGIFLPQYEKETADDKDKDVDVTSWIASSAVLPMPFLSLLGGFLMQKIGRKWSHAIPAIPGIAGWIIIYFAQDVTAILTGRVLTGISNGLFAPITAVYIGEISSPSLRPFLSGCIALNLAMGTLICHLIGTFYSWRTTALICMCFPAFGGIFGIFSNESPMWLISKNKIEEGCVAFNKLRGTSEKAKNELNILLMNQQSEEISPRNSTWKDVIHSLFTKSEIFKPLCLILFYFISVQFSGINVVTFYAINIVELSLGPDFEETYLVMIFMDLIRVLTAILACILLKNMKRRHAAVSGGLGCFLCLIVLAVSTYASEISSSSNITVYASLLALLGYVFFISIALVPLPWCLSGELLPLEIKGLTSGIVCFSAFVAFFTAIKFSPFLFVFLGIHYTFLIFSLFALSGTVLCYLCLPETKNRTLNDIAEHYLKNKH